MADKTLIGAGAGAAVVVLLGCLYKAGKTPTISIDPRSVGQSYDAYAWARHQSGGTVCHHYPTSIGASILPMTFQNDDASPPTLRLEVNDASYAQ